MKTLFLALILILGSGVSQSAVAWPVICVAQCTEVSESGSQAGNASQQVMASANLPEDAFKKLAAKCKKSLVIGTDADAKTISATIQNACVDLVL